jgi:aspartate carbamoyltransferase catalytic subunit
VSRSRDAEGDLGDPSGSDGARSPPPRHSVTSLLQLTSDELRRLARAASSPTPEVPPLARKVVAVLPFGPEDPPAAAWIAAATRLGAGVVRAADVAPADTDPFVVAQTVARWADVLVVSHSHVGFARAVAESTGVAVVNAGEGGGEAPASGIALLAAAEIPEGPGRRLRAAVCGDLADSRSARAFLAALAGVDATVLLVPARGRELTDDDVQRLARRTGRNPLRFEAHAMSSLLDMVDTVLLGPESSPQLPLFREVGVPPDEQARRVRREVEDLDLLFVAPGGGAPDRLVREPFRGGSARVPRGVEHVVPLRALEALLEFAAGATSPADGVADGTGADEGRYRSALGLTCRGERCVAARRRDATVPDFVSVAQAPLVLECLYCGARVQPRFAASKLERRFHRVGGADAARILPANRVLFRSRGEALAAGFEPARRPMPAEEESE